MAGEQPEARHLRCFVAAADAESLRGGARRLGLAQATVTEHVQKLEGLLGFQVFDRVGRSIALTEEGRLLLPRARAAVRAVDSVADGIGASVEGGVGRLVVGAIPTMSPYLLPRVLSVLREEFPACEIVVVEQFTEDLLEGLDDHAIDVAVVSPPIDHPRIEVESIAQERVLVIAPQRGPMPEGEVTLRELRALPRVSLSDMHCLGGQIESFCTHRDLTRQVSCRAAQLDTVFELVRLGLGVSLVPEMAARKRAGSDVRVLELRSAPRREIGIASKLGRSKSMLADRFAALLELVMSEAEG